MGVEAIKTLSTIFYTLAAVLLVTSIVLFFVLDIPKSFGIYTGLSAVRGIKKYQDKIQKENTTKQVGKVSMTSPVSMKSESVPTSRMVSPNTKSQNHTMILNENDTSSEIINEPALPVENDNAVFAVVYELSFTSSTEIIE